MIKKLLCFLNFHRWHVKYEYEKDYKWEKDIIHGCKYCLWCGVVKYYARHDRDGVKNDY